MNKAAPTSTHVKAATACAALILFGLGYSWALPFVHVSCSRNGDQVECQVQKKMLGLIPYETTTIEELQAANFYFEDGTRSSSQMETTDTGYLKLVDAAGVEKNIILESGKEMGMQRSESFAEGIESFLRSDEPTFSSWTVPLIGYGAIVPAALGFLFLGLVTWDFVGTQWKAFRATDADVDSART